MVAYNTSRFRRQLPALLERSWYQPRLVLAGCCGGRSGPDEVSAVAEPAPLPEGSDGLAFRRSLARVAAPGHRCC